MPTTPDKQDLRKRIYYEVPEDLYSDFRKLFPWGTRARILNAVTERLVALARRDERIMGMLLSEAFTINIVVAEDSK